MDFDGLVEWLSGHEGDSVYLEVGTDDPSEAEPTKVYPVAMDVTLGGVRAGSSIDRDRLTVVVPLEGERDRLYFDKTWITSIEGSEGGVRVWFYDSWHSPSDQRRLACSAARPELSRTTGARPIPVSDERARDRVWRR